MASGSINYKLAHGWNLKSFPFSNYLGGSPGNKVDRTPKGLASLFTSSVSGYGTSSINTIVGEGQATFYNPETKEWVGNLTYLDPKKGYWVRSSGSTPVVTITDSLIDKNFTYQFQPGWNLMSYSHVENKPFLTYVNHRSGSTATGHPIFNATTTAGKSNVYIPGTGWAGSLTTLTTGSGYWIKHTPSASGESSTGMNTNLYIVSESTFSSGSDYVECWCGNTGHNSGKVVEEGWGCSHRLYHHDSSSHAPSETETTPHTFGWGQSSEQSFHMFIDNYRGTASLQRADGSTISSSVDSGKGPIVGFFVTSSVGSDRNIDICCGAAIWGGDHPSAAQASSVDDTWVQASGSATATNNMINAWGPEGRYLMTIPTMWYNSHGSLAYYAPINSKLKIKVYDPERDKVFSAKAYKHHGGQEVTLSGSTNRVYAHVHTGSAEVSPLLIRTDQ